jgi:hypothetical protein
VVGFRGTSRREPSGRPISALAAAAWPQLIRGSQPASQTDGQAPTERSHSSRLGTRKRVVMRQRTVVRTIANNNKQIAPAENGPSTQKGQRMVYRSCALRSLYNNSNESQPLSLAGYLAGAAGRVRPVREFPSGGQTSLTMRWRRWGTAPDETSNRINSAAC